MHRLFFALWPDAGLRRGIAEAANGNLELRAAGGRPMAPDRYHMTLQFLGDFDTVGPEVFDALGAAAMRVTVLPPFPLFLDRIGSFGGGRIVWMGCSTPPPLLMRLHRDLGGTLGAADASSKSESTFIPHLTLRRHARGAIEQAIAPLRWWAGDFVLIDSTEGEYRIAGRWPLAGA